MVHREMQGETSHSPTAAEYDGTRSLRQALDETARLSHTTIQIKYFYAK